MVSISAECLVVTMAHLSATNFEHYFVSSLSAQATAPDIGTPLVGSS
jgi:hypothetical protein